MTVNKPSKYEDAQAIADLAEFEIGDIVKIARAGHHLLKGMEMRVEDIGLDHTHGMIPHPDECYKPERLAYYLVSAYTQRPWRTRESARWLRLVRTAQQEEDRLLDAMSDAFWAAAEEEYGPQSKCPHGERPAHCTRCGKREQLLEELRIARQKRETAVRMADERPDDTVDWAGWVEIWDRRIPELESALEEFDFEEAVS